MRYEKKTFNHARLELDGNEYIGCTITSCILVYRGGAGALTGNNISADTTFEFADAAANTVSTMKGIWGMGEWGRNTILATFKTIAPNLKKLN